jgi:AcrR family transcriptional regulator
MDEIISTTRGTSTQDGRVMSVVEAALTLFSEYGFRGTTMEELASAVGIKAPSLYNYIESKYKLLFNIIKGTADRALLELATARDSSSDVVDQLRQITMTHIRYHVRHRREAFIGNRELASLTGEDRAIITCLRDQYEGIIRAVIKSGLDQGRFNVASPQLASYAILEMGVGVATWFRSDGPVSEAEVSKQYGEFALRIVQAK